MKKIRNLIIRVMLVLAVLLLAGTGTASENATPVYAAAKVKISKKNVKLQKGKSVTLKITGTKKTVKWTTSNKKIATVTKKGKVTAKKVGKAKITATVAKKTYTCTVKVVEASKTAADDTDVAVSSIKLNATTKSLSIGEEFQLKATVSPANATNSIVTWSSSDEDVATVDGGIVIAKTAGTTTITAKAGDRKATCRVTVKKIAVTSITLDISSKTVYVGDSFLLNATILPENATDKIITWSSSNESVATVNDGEIVAKAAGTATITAKIGYKSAKCHVTVLKQTAKLGMGEVWTVPDQWRFVINSVEIHRACNSYSSKTGEEVVIIHYSYYNDGYTGSIQDLYISGYSMDVYDENGSAASTYPCTHDISPKVCAVGTNCTASAAFILPKKSSTITVNIEHYTSNGTGKENAQFTLNLTSSSASTDSANSEQTTVTATDYKANATKVKQYILSDGLTSSEGYKYLPGLANSDSNPAMLYYIPSTDELVIKAGTTSGGMSGVSYIYYSVASTKVTKVVFSLTESDLNHSYEAEAAMDISSYTSSTNLTFAATSGNPYKYETETSFQSTCNSTTRFAALVGDTILLTNFQMQLSDLGFISY